MSYAAASPDKGFIVTAEMTARLLAACPDHHWRVIVLMCRHGGLRCPSEVLSPRRQDIFWAHKRIIIYSPKTAHHIGKDNREIPPFPQLRPQLQESFELAAEGE